MASDFAEVVAAVGGVLGAIGGLYAARAASRSASLAQAVAASSERAEHRALHRELVSGAQRVCSEADRVEALGADLKLQYQSAFAFAGQFDSSRQRVYVERIDQRLATVLPLKSEAQELLNRHSQLASASQDDITLALSELERKFVVIQSLREEMQREFAEVAANNRIHREQRISGAHRGGNA